MVVFPAIRAADRADRPRGVDTPEVVDFPAAVDRLHRPATRAVAERLAAEEPLAATIVKDRDSSELTSRPDGEVSIRPFFLLFSGYIQKCWLS